MLPYGPLLPTKFSPGMLDHSLLNKQPLYFLWHRQESLA
jgi:hypothetical protein